MGFLFAVIMGKNFYVLIAIIDYSNISLLLLHLYEYTNIIFSAFGLSSLCHLSPAKAIEHEVVYSHFSLLSAFHTLIRNYTSYVVPNVGPFI